jgi:hypothetical protein
LLLALNISGLTEQRKPGLDFQTDTGAQISLLPFALWPGRPYFGFADRLM